MVFETPVNCTKFEENSLDTAHLSFVHKAFGNRMDPKASLVPIERTAYGARVARERTSTKPEAKSGILGARPAQPRGKTRVELEFSKLGLCTRIHPTFRPGMAEGVISSSKPIHREEERRGGKGGGR